MTATGRRWAVTGVGGLGLADLTLRVAPEVLGVGENLVVPALFGLTTRSVVSSPVLGTAIGSVLLAVLVAYLAPGLFPGDTHTSRYNLPLRGVVGVSVLAVSLYTREVLVRTVTGSGTWVPVDPSPRTGAVLLGAVALGLFVVLVVPWHWLTPRTPGDPLAVGDDRATPTVGPSGDHDGDTRFAVVPSFDTLVTGTGLVVGAGAVMGAVSLLYPLPEVIAVLAGVYVHVPVGRVPRTDVTERLVLAARTVWAGRLAAITLVYAVGVLLWLAVAGATTPTTGLPLSGYAGSGAAVWLAYACVVLVPVVYTVRFIDDAYRPLVTGEGGGPSLALLVPPGVLSGLSLAVGAAGLGESPTATAEAWTTATWVVAVGGAALALLLAAAPWRWWGRQAPASDDSLPPSVALPVGFVSLVASQSATRDVVALHLTGDLTAVTAVRAGAVGVATGGGAALAALAAPWLLVALLWYPYRFVARAYDGLVAPIDTALAG